MLPRSVIGPKLRHAITVQILPPFAPETQIRIEAGETLTVRMDKMNKSLRTVLDSQRRLHGSRRTLDTSQLSVSTTTVALPLPTIRRWTNELKGQLGERVVTEVGKDLEAQSDSVSILLDATLYRVTFDLGDSTITVEVQAPEPAVLRRSGSPSLAKTLSQILDDCLKAAANVN